MDTAPSRCSDPEKEGATELENIENVEIGHQEARSKTSLGFTPTRTRTHEPGYENKVQACRNDRLKS